MAGLKKSNQFDLDEVFRQLRTNIEFMQMDDKLQVINVTSTTKNEGKSTITVNLAKIFAARYPNVLLIDCDLRNPSVHRILEQSNARGLTNVLSSFTPNTMIDTLPETKHFRFNPEDQDLSVITGGSRVPNPTEILSSKRFGAFIEEARKQYNYIIIDCPPIGYVADAVPVSNLSDGTIFVVSSEENHKKSVRMAINDLKRNGANLLGVVLNKVDVSTQKYGYGYYYGYGEDGQKKKRRR